MAVVLRSGTTKRSFPSAEGAAAVKGTAFRATGNGVCIDTTPVSLKAAVAAKRTWITRVEFANKTAGEYPVVELLEDEGVTPVILGTFIPHSPGGAAGMGWCCVDFPDPIEVTAGKSIGWRHQGNVGDTYAAMSGFVED